MAHAATLLKRRLKTFVRKGLLGALFALGEYLRCYYQRRAFILALRCKLIDEVQTVQYLAGHSQLQGGRIKMWESRIDINKVVEIRTRTICYLGVGALQKVNDIFDNLKKQGVDKVLVVSDPVVYQITGV
jgi:hypothetical protein